jgi:hypothetical protein
MAEVSYGVLTFGHICNWGQVPRPRSGLNLGATVRFHVFHSPTRRSPGLPALTGQVGVGLMSINEDRTETGVHVETLASER